MSVISVIENLENAEQVSFLHGYLYAKAEEISKTKEVDDINRIIKMILNGEWEKIYNHASMLKINGNYFRCHCGCNVFGKYTNGTYECNACGDKYEVG